MERSVLTLMYVVHLYAINIICTIINSQPDLTTSCKIASQLYVNAQVFL